MKEPAAAESGTRCGPYPMEVGLVRNRTDNGPGMPRITAWIGLVLSALMIILAVTALAGCQVHGACHHHGGLKTVINGIQYCNDGTEV